MTASETPSTAVPSPEASTTPAKTPSTPTPANATPVNTPAGATPTTAAAPATAATPTVVAGPGAGSPTLAVQGWIAAVAEQKHTAACALMLEPGSDGALHPISNAQCTQGAKALDSLRTAWVKGPTALPPKVSVTAFSSSTATTAVVSDTAVLLNGRSLRTLELIGSTVPSGGTFELSLGLSKYRSGWYVSALNMDANTGTRTGTVPQG
ncbi:hypothetical protein [Streptacidiphilus carbonis]|uniref:hypothetical protein n=1 Tax=Streptacidiphilus carbonis TaxID=105422 RepID=UPI00157B07B4|nr:hypothetical protein [Streptacidiphilus carbonis]